MKVEEIFFCSDIFYFLKQKSTRESIKYVDNDRDTFDLFLCRIIQIGYLEFSRASGE